MLEWEEYEIFVQKLYQAILDTEEFTKQKNIKIEHDKKIIDNLGDKQQFDLYWEYKYGGITYKTIIECKNYNSKIEIGEINELIGKIQGIPDIKSIFATKIGYQKGAEKRAKNKNIDLLIVREQREDDWQKKDGTPRLKEINIDLHLSVPARIIHFHPIIDVNWMIKNTEFNPETLPGLSGQNIDIFISDRVKNDTYSLYELAERLGSISSEKFGVLCRKESFEDAYLIYQNLRLKMTSYHLKYVNSKPITESILIDYGKELLGVIEYLGEKHATAIFKQGVDNKW